MNVFEMCCIRLNFFHECYDDADFARKTLLSMKRCSALLKRVRTSLDILLLSTRTPRVRNINPKYFISLKKPDTVEPRNSAHFGNTETGRYCGILRYFVSDFLIKFKVGHLKKCAII